MTALPALPSNQTGVFPLLQRHSHFFFFFIEREILGGGEVGWRGAPVTAGDWRLRAVATLALGFSQLGGRGQVEPDK